MKIESNSNWMPAYIGLGAMKAGSAWLNQCLWEHPEIEPAIRKEVNFFNSADSFKKGVTHYRTFFQEDSDKLFGEITPHYLFEPEVPERIYRLFPRVKLIVCLRNPVDRAWSHYKYGLATQGRVTVYKDFREAIEKDHSLIDYGRYAEQLKRYFNFFEKEQIKVFLYEDLTSNPVETVQDIYEFIGLRDTMYVPAAATARFNETGGRVVKISNKFLWRYLLKARTVLHRAPTIEKHIKNTGIISDVKKKFRTFEGSTADTVKHKSPTAIPYEDKQYVLEKLSNDICSLEDILGRRLTTWKS